MHSLRFPVVSTVAAVALLAGAPALAQSRAAPQASGSMAGQAYPTQTAPDTSATPPASSQAPAASTGSAANTSATTSTTAQLTTGLTVKDRTGAAISTDPKTGQQLATIQMGSESFRLPTDRLGVFNGAANVNLTQADIEAQLHPAKK